MAYTEVKNLKYGKRLGDSFKGIGMGLVLLLGATVLLWWNEGRAVKESKMLGAAEKECIDVVDMAAIDPALEGKLIHAVAVATTDEVLSDPQFALSRNAIKLSRSVEYYQYKESSSTVGKDKVGGGREETTTYTYTKGWCPSPVNSQDFKDPEYRNSNFVRKNVENHTETASRVTFGAYMLPSSLISAIPSDAPVTLPADVAGKDSLCVVSGNVLYYGKSPENPEVGDVRVTFRMATPGEASILAKVNGSSFEAYSHKNGHGLCVISMGRHSMDEMFQSREKSNHFILWLVRLAGLLLLIWGFKAMFNIIVTILKLIPPLASIAEVGVNFVCAVLGFVWAFMVVAVAWVAYRPLVAVLALAAVALLVWLLVKKCKSK